MPAKSKRKQQLEGTREAKRLKGDDYSEVASTDIELGTSTFLDDSGVYVSDDDEIYV